MLLQPAPLASLFWAVMTRVARAYAGRCDPAGNDRFRDTPPRARTTDMGRLRPYPIDTRGCLETPLGWRQGGVQASRRYLKLLLPHPLRTTSPPQEAIGNIAASDLRHVGSRLDAVCYTSQTGRGSRVSFPGEVSGNVALMSLWLVSGHHHTASAVINESNMT